MPVGPVREAGLVLRGRARTESDLDDADRRFLMAHDPVPFVRWESGQQYATALMLDLIAAQQRGEPLHFDEALAEAVLAATGGTVPRSPARA